MSRNIPMKSSFKGNLPKIGPSPGPKRTISDKVFLWNDCGLVGNLDAFTRQTKTAISPRSGFVQYGLYSNAHRGKIRKTEVDPSHGPVIEDETTFVFYHKVSL